MFTGNRNWVKTLLPISAVCILSACQVLPKVSYKEFKVDGNKGDLEGYNKFKLSSSLILIDNQKDEKVKAISITSVLAEDPSNIVYGIVPADQPGISTAMKVNARENTMLVESIGTEIKDNRVKFIQDFGGVFTALVGMGVAADTPGCKASQLPQVIDVSRHLNVPTLTSVTQKGTLTKGCEYIVKYGPIPPDAVSRNEYPFSKRQHTLFYSACRDATLTINIDGQRVVSTVKVADPNYLQTVVYPAKGKISMHSACGVSVESELVETATTPEILNALIAQAKSLRDAKEGQ